MKLLRTSKSAWAVWIVLAASGAIPPDLPGQTPASAKADNTAVNKRDRDTGAPTADKQKNNKSDTVLAANIRKALIADKSLSTYGHNVKIVAQNGVVTLKGPVHTDDEVNTIVAKAAEVTGDRSKIVNELSVKK